MPQITVTISQNSTEVTNKSFNCESDKLPDLLKSLAQAKTDTNAELTKLIEASKSTAGNGKQQDVELDEEESSEDDDENDVENQIKKIKT